MNRALRSFTKSHDARLQCKSPLNACFCMVYILSAFLYEHRFSSRFYTKFRLWMLNEFLQSEGLYMCFPSSRYVLCKVYVIAYVLCYDVKESFP